MSISPASPWRRGTARSAPSIRRRGTKRSATSSSTTGPPIFGKQVILPGGVVRRLDLDNETVFVDRTRDEILDAPAFDESRADDAGYLEELGAYYATGRQTDNY